MGGGEVWIEVVAHLAAALALREQYDEPFDRRGERSRFRASGLGEQGNQVRMGGEEVELRGERGADALSWTVAGGGEVAERVLELGRPAGKYGAKQATLGMEVVEQQLLVDARPAGDVVDPRSFEAASGELFAGSRDDT